MSPSRPRILHAALALLALIPAAGCVAASRHDRALAELERIRRENLELRRDLAEQRVRLQEMAEAAGLRPAPAPAPAEPAPEPGAPAEGEEPPRTPAMVLAPAGPGPGGAIEEETIRDPEPSLKAAGEDGGRILELARRYRDDGKIPQAISVYSRFIRDYPFSAFLPEAFVERGRTRLKSGDRQGALEDFQTVVEAFPGSPQAGEARGELRRLGGP